MPRKKKAKSKKPIQIKRDMVKPGKVAKGDFCYFISSDGKTRFGEVTRVFDDDNHAIQLQCQTNWSFHTTVVRLAAWDEKSLKGLKWDIVMKKLTKDEVNQ